MSGSIRGCIHSRRSSGERTSGRPPLLKVSLALIRASISQGDPKAATRLLGNAVQSVRSLPAEEQRDLIRGVFEEVRHEVTDFFVGLTPARGRG